MHLIVDAMNVIGSRPDGWWRDREAAYERLIGRLRHLAVATGEAITVVLDRVGPAGVESRRADGVVVRYARRLGRDAADEVIADLVAEDPDVATMIIVYTADRELRRIVEAAGAQVHSPRRLLARLDALE